MSRKRSTGAASWSCQLASSGCGRCGRTHQRFRAGRSGSTAPPRQAAAAVLDGAAFAVPARSRSGGRPPARPRSRCFFWPSVTGMTAVMPWRRSQARLAAAEQALSAIARPGLPWPSFPAAADADGLRQRDEPRAITMLAGTGQPGDRAAAHRRIGADRPVPALGLITAGPQPVQDLLPGPAQRPAAPIPRQKGDGDSVGPSTLLIYTTEPPRSTGHAPAGFHPSPASHVRMLS